MALIIPDFLKRSLIMDELNIGTIDSPEWVMLGTGFDEVNNSPSAQNLTTRFVNEDSDTTITTGYAPVINFSLYEIKDDELIETILDIARKRKIGAGTIMGHRRVYLSSLHKTAAGSTTPGKYKAFEQLVNVSVSDENPRDNLLGATGTLTYVSDFAFGSHDVDNKTFTPDSD